jgi:predicted HTH transcriptional regulator
LSLNPAQFISEAINQVDDMLDQVGKLNDADRIRAMIRGIIENDNSEFKQTWRLPTQGEKKDHFESAKKIIYATVFKVINSYLNADGGTLVIGVVDDTHEITGIEPELAHYYKKQAETVEKRIDLFEIQFHKALKKAFKKEFVDLVNYRPVLIEEKYVWMVVCEPAKKPCVIIDREMIKILNGQEFYVREGGNSEPYSGQDRMDYIDRHFYSN